MRLDVAFTPAEVKGTVGRRVVVVIDVLRATTTIAQALVNGAHSVVPVGSVDEAVRKADQIGRDAVLLCGERDAEPIKGFSLGNSPLEFTADRVAGKTLVMTTTNGTVALLAAAGAERVYAGAFVNISAVADLLVQHGSDALVLCAGRENAFALEDALCAGGIARRVRAAVQSAGGTLSGNDALGAAMRLARRPPTARALGRTAAGRRLVEIGRREDVIFCAGADRHSAVPMLDGHRLRLYSPEAA